MIGEHGDDLVDDLVEVAVAGDAGNAVIARQRGDIAVLPEPAQGNTACQ
ncbi:hypothetical protein ABZX92_41545 [Lentzea sp. NPDC006480]